ncbi:hypothetical protein [Alteromonas gracilis]|uniref:hypothetical protein n=1 Tax=Alteromonas gracilis TaxID=1479524 RepID=UPI00373652B7
MAFILLAAFIVIGLLFALTSGSDAPINEVRIPEDDNFVSSATSHKGAFLSHSNLDHAPSNSLVTSTGNDCSPELLVLSSDSGFSDINI